ncbi:MAG: DUF2703 domain-containing protein [Ignavibacteriales bacterium]|nr:DUF2703 domain-containing protein [Ignavibacteriales bacterium]
MNEIRLDYQYFDGCPQHTTMWKNLKEAIIGLEDKTVVVKVQVNDAEIARRICFRGSPTLLIAGEDLEMMPSPEQASLSCRYYSKGIPSSSMIRSRILQKLAENDLG